MLPAGWQTALSKRSRKVQLLTLNLYGADPHGPPHLALVPGSFCFATDFDVHISSDYGTLPFLPLMAEWAPVSRKLVPQERRAETSTARPKVMYYEPFVEALSKRGSVHGVTARIDLWTDGIPIEHVFPRIAGRVTGVDPGPTAKSPMTLSVADGEPDRVVSYPGGTITREDFPDAPKTVVDVTARQTIVGFGPDFLRCIPIDNEGRRFYVADPPYTQQPRVERGGVQIFSGVRLETATTPTGWRYTQIVFDEPVGQYIEGESAEVTVSGGVGVTESGAIDFLLNQAGVLPSPGTRAALDQIRASMDLTGLMSATDASVLQLVRKRFVPQTPYAFTLHRDRAELIDLRADRVARISLGVGTGLMFRMPEQGRPADTDSIYNVFEVQCGRNDLSGLPMCRIIRDRYNGTPSQRARCGRSEDQHGRRELEIPAHDLAVQTAPSGAVLGSIAGEALAGLAVELHTPAWQHQRYLADWVCGLALELGMQVDLTDAENGFDETASTVVQIDDTPTGPVVALQTEALP